MVLNRFCIGYGPGLPFQKGKIMFHTVDILFTLITATVFCYDLPTVKDPDGFRGCLYSNFLSTIIHRY